MNRSERIIQWVGIFLLIGFTSLFATLYLDVKLPGAKTEPLSRPDRVCAHHDQGSECPSGHQQPGGCCSKPQAVKDKVPERL